MDMSEYILIGVGTCLSILGFFLKKESRRLGGVVEKVDVMNITLAKNEVRDTERWNIIDKRLEDRRQDVRKLYDLVQKNDK
jgi:hypothetical protein